MHGSWTLSIAAREWGGPVSRCPRCASSVFKDRDGWWCAAHGEVSEPLNVRIETRLRWEMSHKLSEGRAIRGRYRHHKPVEQLALF